jgi:hypothetical protein
VTKFAAQQSALPAGPQVAAKPLQDGRGSQTFVAVLQMGVVPLQSAFDKHTTHFDVVPKSLHFGMAAPHAPHVAAQLASALHTAHTPAPPHCWLLSHALSVGA